MPRLMSVAFTEEAVRDRTKTVTRRKGWQVLKPGDRLTLCRKVMGRKAGEPLVRLAEVEVVSVRRELLCAIRTGGADEMAREGFPGMDVDEFMQRYFIDAQGIYPLDHVTRIEWVYVGDEISPESLREIDADSRFVDTQDARDRYEEVPS